MAAAASGHLGLDSPRGLDTGEDGQPVPESKMKCLTHYPYYAQLCRTLAVRALNIATGKRCSGYEKMEPFFRGKSGLEIGGPSSLFKGNHLIPVYDRCEAIDSANWSDKTVWTRDRKPKAFGKTLSRSFVLDATDLHSLADASYDFLLASHVMEHIANPLRALSEWKRVVRPGGAVLVIVPHKMRTFDVRRPFTTFEHLIDDFRKGTPETDTTHLPEVLELHDWRRDAGCPGPEHHRARCLENAANRCIHHHVYDAELLAHCFEFCEMETVNLTIEYPYHIVGMAKKV